MISTMTSDKTEQGGLWRADVMVSGARAFEQVHQFTDANGGRLVWSTAFEAANLGRDLTQDVLDGYCRSMLGSIIARDLRAA